MTQNDSRPDTERSSAHTERVRGQIQPEQSSRQTPQTQASESNSPPQQERRVAPGRRPLFRS